MHVLVVLHSAAAVLLLAAGISKVTTPRAGSEFFAALGLPAGVSWARLVGLLESATGAAALALVWTPVAVAVAASYALFAVVALRGLVAGAENCGCFGRFEAPPSVVHVAGNLALAGISATVAARGERPMDVLGAALNHGAGSATALVTLTLVIAGLVFVVFTALPEATRVGAGQNGAEGREGLRGSVSREFSINRETPALADEALA